MDLITGSFALLHSYQVGVVVCSGSTGAKLLDPLGRAAIKPEYNTGVYWYNEVEHCRSAMVSFTGRISSARDCSCEGFLSRFPLSWRPDCAGGPPHPSLAWFGGWVSTSARCLSISSCAISWFCDCFTIGSSTCRLDARIDMWVGLGRRPGFDPDDPQLSKGRLFGSNRNETEIPMDQPNIQVTCAMSYVAPHPRRHGDLRDKSTEFHPPDRSVRGLTRRGTKRAHGRHMEDTPPVFETILHFSFLKDPSF